MPNASQLRAQIESQLAERIPSALTPTPRLVRETISTGIHPIDEMLGGGLPLGAITEVIGSPSSGRTTFAMSVLASVCRSGHVCAWIDASNEFNPVSAAAAGIVLSQLLLVRCGVQAKPTARANQQPPQQPSKRIQHSSDRPSTGGGSPHPRSEVSGLGNAVGELFRQRLSDGSTKPGTPSANNRRFGKVARSEQTNSDRLPPRRAAYLGAAASTTFAHSPVPRADTLKYTASFEPARAGMEQALQVIDVLLQTGGFRTIVMDFSSFTPERVTMIPLATWFRFRALADNTHAGLLLLTQHACAKSSAEVSLRLVSDEVIGDTHVMTGASYHAVILKHAFTSSVQSTTPIRKAPQSARWHSRSAWAAQ